MRRPNGETSYVELSPTGVRRLAGGEGSIVRLSNVDVAERHRHPQGIKWMSLNRLMRLRKEERERSRFGAQSSQASRTEIEGVRRLPLNEYAVLLCDVLQCYSFPCVTFDFRGCPDGPEPANPETGRGCYANMRAVEKYIGGLLRSSDPDDVRNGLSNVLYWGWAQRPPGFQSRRVVAFRDHVTDDRLDMFMKLVPRVLEAHQSAGEHLRALRDLRLAQFSQMSFTTKILMFLRPESYPVLDLRIARACANRTDYPPLQGLRFSTSIPITASNATNYERWAHWCQGIAARVNGCPDSRRGALRAVDVERALFALTDRHQEAKMRLLLAAPAP